MAREMIDIVTGKSPYDSSLTGNSAGGASSKLIRCKGSLNAKRARSLLVQIEAAAGECAEIASDIRSKKDK
jgi:hypothetical protein